MACAVRRPAIVPCSVGLELGFAGLGPVAGGTIGSATDINRVSCPPCTPQESFVSKMGVHRYWLCDQHSTVE